MRKKDKITKAGQRYICLQTFDATTYIRNMEKKKKTHDLLLFID